MPTTEKHWWSSIFSMGASVISKTIYGTAMDSILRLVALITLPCFVIYAFTNFWLLLIIGSAPILQFIRVYDHFMKNNPKMLRSEKHEETMFRIASSLGQKGHEITEAVVDALPAVKVNATERPQLIAAKTERGKNE